VDYAGKIEGGPEMVQSVGAMTNVLRSQGKFDLGENLYREEPRLRESLQRLVQLCEATGQPEKAAEWSKKLVDFDKTQTEKTAAVPKP
jgi:hypothetical protein